MVMKTPRLTWRLSNKTSAMISLIGSGKKGFSTMITFLERDSVNKCLLSSSVIMGYQFLVQAK